MSSLKLFVSHSSRLDDVAQDQFDEDHNWNLLSGTCEKLKQVYGDRIEILVDQDERGLYSSCDWEQRLNEWLAECHAAVILFSKRAHETSDWVKKEATILSWRREVEENFKLIPVLLQGQTGVKDLEKDIWSILHIEKSQCRQSAATCDDIVSAVTTALGEPDVLACKFPQTPFEKLASHVSALLSQDTKAQILEDIWNGLSDNGLKPACHPNNRERFATALSRYLIRDGERCLDIFLSVMDKLRPNPDEEKSEELLKIVRSLWVDAKAAAVIPSSLKQESIVAMSGWLLFHPEPDLKTKHYTIDRYIDRAWPDTDCIKVIPVTSADTEEIKKEIRYSCRMNAMPYPPDVIDQKIAEKKFQLIIFLDAKEENGGIPDPRQLKALAELRATTYPKLIIILAVGARLPQSLEDIALPINGDTGYKQIIIPVIPPLNDAVELEQFSKEQDVKELLNRKYGNRS